MSVAWAVFMAVCALAYGGFLGWMLGDSHGYETGKAWARDLYTPERERLYQEIRELRGGFALLKKKKQARKR